jgi:hypothetical protein
VVTILTIFGIAQLLFPTGMNLDRLSSSRDSKITLSDDSLTRRLENDEETDLYTTSSRFDFVNSHV